MEIAGYFACKTTGGGVLEKSRKFMSTIYMPARYKKRATYLHGRIISIIVAVLL